METRHLGEIKGPLIAFGGPYSNASALRALLRVAGDAGIGASSMICTGDVVAYGADAATCISLIRQAGCTTVAGNVERQLATRQSDCGCGFEAGSACDLLSVGWYGHAESTVTDAHRAWMAHLPDIVTFDNAGRRIAVIHGGVSDIARFVWSVSPRHVFEQEIALLRSAVGDIDMVIAGHSGIPFRRRIGGVDWINAGVIGMPPNDGGMATRYALIEDGAVDFCALLYNTAAAVEAMRQVGLTQGYERSLITGYWPSEDVLPQELRRDFLATRKRVVL